MEKEGNELSREGRREGHRVALCDPGASETGAEVLSPPSPPPSTPTPATSVPRSPFPRGLGQC